MREILFRGKRIDNGEWVEGYFSNETCDGPFSPMYEQANIIRKRTGYWHPVDPDTVGQFTGLHDKNGKRIFEGDIVLFKWDKLCDYCRVIEFDDGEFCAKPVRPMEGIWTIRICGENKKFSVIGNIHDNPELLEVGG